MSEHVGGARRVFPHAMAHPAGFGTTPQLTRLALSAPKSIRRKRHESVMSSVMGSGLKVCYTDEYEGVRQEEHRYFGTRQLARLWVPTPTMWQRGSTRK